jgi:hypothetical protein
LGPVWLENRLTALPVFGTIRRPAQADVAPLLSIARWIALQEQGDRTSAALSGGGAIP